MTAVIQQIHDYCHILSCTFKWIRKKVKCTLVQALRLCTGCTANRESRGVALLFLDNGTRRGWRVSVTPWPLFTPGKTRNPLYRRLGGTQGRSGQVQKNLAPTGIRSPDRPTRNQSLYRLRYPAHFEWINSKWLEIVLLLTCSTSGGMGRSKGWANGAAARGANTALESSEIWCWCTQLFYTRKNFENYPQFRYAPSKIFASPVLGRKSSKNVGLKGAKLLFRPGRQIISLRGAPTCLGPFLGNGAWCTHLYVISVDLNRNQFFQWALIFFPMDSDITAEF